MTHPIFNIVPLWVYFMSIGFTGIGIYEFRNWRKERNPSNTPEEIAYKWIGLLPAFIAFGGGIVSLIIIIYMDCTGHSAQ